MTVTAAVLSLVLGVVCVVAGVPKLLLSGTPTANLRRHGFGDGQIRFIGVAEAAAAAGLTIGIRYPSLGFVAAAGMVILLIGAVGCHIKWGDYTGTAADCANAMPAAVCAILAIATASTLVASGL